MRHCKATVLNHPGTAAERLASHALISRVQTGVRSTGTESASDPECAWAFDTDNANQCYGGVCGPLQAVAVCPCDVPAEVLEPQRAGVRLAQGGLSHDVVGHAGVHAGRRRGQRVVQGVVEV